MNRTLLFTITQVALAACAVYMAILVHFPLFGCIGLALLFATAVLAQIAPGKFGKLWIWAGIGTVIALVALYGKLRDSDADDYFSVLAAQISLAIFITGNRPGAGEGKSRWNALGIVWGFAAAVIALMRSYFLNLPGEFALALAGCLFLLVLCRVCFRLRAFGIQIVNTLLLLLVVIPVADLCMRLRSRHDMNADPAKYYSYAAAKKNPSAYALWTRYYEEQWVKMWWTVAEIDPRSYNYFRFKPDTQAYLFHSLIKINHKGFRGPEIPAEKGNTYRIVALGESTTFGCTMNSDDRPWPEWLEQHIRDRLHLSRPVEVINAGTPAAKLPGNVTRLTHEILALKPDMIISYHGFNGFDLLIRDLTPLVAQPPPEYHIRPLKLLADFEYAIKSRRHKEAIIASTPHDHAKPVVPLESEYAKGYRDLIQICRTNGIQLVMADYSMAVNPQSDRDIVAFYEMTCPAVASDIKANVAHTEIVKTLAAEHPEIIFVDTQPTLDGKDTNFIDLIHFTQDGDKKMSELFFNAIRTNLETTIGTNGANGAATQGNQTAR